MKKIFLTIFRLILVAIILAVGFELGCRIQTKECALDKGTWYRTYKNISDVLQSKALVDTNSIVAKGSYRAIEGLANSRIFVAEVTLNNIGEDGMVAITVTVDAGAGLCGQIVHSSLSKGENKIIVVFPDQELIASSISKSSTSTENVNIRVNTSKPLDVVLKELKAKFASPKATEVPPAPAAAPVAVPVKSDKTVEPAKTEKTPAVAPAKTLEPIKTDKTPEVIKTK